MTDNSSGSSSSGSNCSTFDYANANYILSHLDNRQIKSDKHFHDHMKDMLGNESPNEKTEINGKDISSKLDGYCEFCRRNFCNKYYLKRHKLEVHGIYTNNDKASWKRLKMKTPKNSENQRIEMDKSISTFSLSLKEEMESSSVPKPIKNPFHIESLNCPSKAKSDLAKYDKLWSHINQTIGDSNAENEVDFNSCLNPKENKTISCPYCYQMFNRSNVVMHHLITSHGDLMQDFMKFVSFSHETMEQYRNCKLLQNQPQPNILQMIYGQFINSTNPITDRVKCDICYKDICNKYYLKLHKQRMHSSQCSQTAFKITSLCGDDFKNGMNQNDEEITVDSMEMKNTPNSECISNKFIMDMYVKGLRDNLVKENTLKNEKVCPKQEDNETIFCQGSKEIPSSDEIKLKTQINNRAYQQNNFFNIYKLIDETYNLNQDLFIRKEAFHESPLDLSFKKSEWMQFNKKQISYSSKSVNPIRKKIKRRLSQLKFLNRSSWNLMQKFRKYKQIQIMNHKLKHKIAFEVKEFLTETYPLELDRNEVHKTDFIFGKKVVDLPVTSVYKSNPFAFLLQPVL